MSPVSSSIRKMVPAPSPEMVYLMAPSPSSESEWIWGGREEDQWVWGGPSEFAFLTSFQTAVSDPTGNYGSSPTCPDSEPGTRRGQGAKGARTKGNAHHRSPYSVPGSVLSDSHTYPFRVFEKNV